MTDHNRLQMFDDALNYSDASYMMELCEKEHCWNPYELHRRYANLKNIDIGKCRYSNPFAEHQIEQCHTQTILLQKDDGKDDGNTKILEKQLEAMMSICSQLSSLESLANNQLVNRGIVESISNQLSSLESIANSQSTGNEVMTSMNEQLSSIADSMKSLVQDRDMGSGVKVKAIRVTEV